MTERIVVEIDDSQLDSVLGRLQTVSSVAKATTGSTNLANRLPTINREMRVILGQLPGMRQAIQAMFAARRQLRGIDKGGMGLWLATAANAIILINMVQAMLKQMKQEREKFERFVMESRGFTRAELKRELAIARHYRSMRP